jgi:hypothetical protein
MRGRNYGCAVAVSKHRNEGGCLLNVGFSGPSLQCVGVVANECSTDTLTAGNACLFTAVSMCTENVRIFSSALRVVSAVAIDGALKTAQDHRRRFEMGALSSPATFARRSSLYTVRAASVPMRYPRAMIVSDGFMGPEVGKTLPSAA